MSQAEMKPTRGVQATMLLRGVLAVPFMAAILFIPAGTLRWPIGWAFIGAHVAYFSVMLIVLAKARPYTLEQRMKVATPETKGWDLPLTGSLSVFLLAAWVAGGLDVRFGWPPEVALAVQIAALACVPLGYVLFGWAMISNRFFARDVRIQGEAGHTVQTGGPYRFVRHPGYAGFLLATLASPLALGSLWALVPAGLASAGLVIRTALEDRTLRDELDGYTDYARRTRFRLVPGVW